MIKFIKSRLGRFARCENGNASVEFMLAFPLYLAFILMSIELGFVTMRHALLERGLDMAVRDIRLGTGKYGGGEATHTKIKETVCENALLLLDCENSLKLEMSPADIRAYSSLDTTADCTDKASTGDPVYEVIPGQQNELVLLRACYKYDPLFPEAFLGSALQKDSSGQSSIVSTTAFVQEPL